MRMRILVTLLLALHGAIHLLGFLKPWKLAAVPQLSGRALVPLSEGAGRAVGALWLAACLLLIAAAALRIARQEAWWVAAAAGLVLSQALIVLQWQDAKAGTLANVLLVIPVVVAGATAGFRHRVDDEVLALHARVPAAAGDIVRPEELDRLPAPVQRWLQASGVVGRERTHAVRLRQRGQMRTSPTGAWMPAEAEQYFSVDEPGFVWRVDVEMMGFLPIAGRDKYESGRGNMRISLGSLVPLVNAAGPEIDQGTMMRYLGEIVWFPSAALSPYIAWEPVSATDAKATMTYRGVTASAVFTFDERGRFVRMAGERYRAQDGASTLDPWLVPATEWRAIRGVEIPVKGEVLWKLREGDFSYYRWEILDVEYNRPELYRPAASPRDIAAREIALAR